MLANELRRIGFKAVREFGFNHATVMVRDFSWDACTRVVHDNTAAEVHFRIHQMDTDTELVGQRGDHYKLPRLMVTAPTPPTGLERRVMSGFARKPVHNMRVVSCRFEQRWFEEELGRPINWDAFDAGSFADFTNHRIDQMMRWMAQELEDTGSLSKSLLRSLCSSIGIEVGRQYDQQCARLSNADGGSHIAAIRSIVKDASRFPTADAVAERLSVKRSTLDRLLVQAGESTLRDLLEAMRFEMAQSLLKETTIPLKVLSFRLGYSHQSAFTVAFGRRIGCTPSEYREASRLVVGGGIN